jgi:hypothetical protein
MCSLLQQWNSELLQVKDEHLHIHTLPLNLIALSELNLLDAKFKATKFENGK